MPGDASAKCVGRKVLLARQQAKTRCGDDEMQESRLGTDGTVALLHHQIFRRSDFKPNRTAVTTTLMNFHVSPLAPHAAFKPVDVLKRFKPADCTSSRGRPRTVAFATARNPCGRCASRRVFPDSLCRPTHSSRFPCMIENCRGMDMGIPRSGRVNMRTAYFVAAQI